MITIACRPVLDRVYRVLEWDGRFKDRTFSEEEIKDTFVLNTMRSGGFFTVTIDYYDCQFVTSFIEHKIIQVQEQFKIPASIIMDYRTHLRLSAYCSFLANKDSIELLDIYEDLPIHVIDKSSVCGKDATDFIAIGLDFDSSNIYANYV